MSATDVSLLQTLDLERIDEHRYSAVSVAGQYRAVVFGGQLLGQMMIAAAHSVPDKRVRSIQAVFARPGRLDAPLDIVVDPLADGRALASATVSVSQGERALCRALVLLDAGDADVVRHQRTPAPVAGPDEATALHWAEPGSEARVVDGVDLVAAEATGPPELDVWVRFDGAPAGDDVVNKALAAWYTDAFVIGSTLRPHAGVGMGMAHDTLATGVLTHALAFHEPCHAGDWLRVSQESTHAGAGRCYGRGTVSDGEGRLLASFAQEAMIRNAGGGA
jgi:acyl-CoA thioesterase